MKVWRTLRPLVLALLLFGLAYGIHYAWYAFPIVSGYDAKYVCSCMFVGGQKEDSVRKDLSGFPFSLAGISVNEKDSSVTATVWGMARKKAIFRKGLGCTLVNGISEHELRSQRFALAPEVFLNTDDIYWPGGDRITDSAMPGVNQNKLINAINWAFLDATTASKKTRAVIVVYKGRLVGEKYAPGYDRHSRFMGWSVAKSFTGAVAGILEGEKKLDISLPVPLPGLQGSQPPKNQITTEHILQQTTGINFTENYSRYSDVTNMLFNEPDMAGYTMSLKMKYDPGTHFYYSSGNSNILSKLVREIVGPDQYPAYLYTSLFHKIGMNSVVMEPDASGTIVGSSYVFATARDYARFGLLYQNDGVWNGNRILPEGWVKRATTPPPANHSKVYGYQVWLNGQGNDPGTLNYPEVPSDMYYADGFGGQDIYVIPSRQLVIVRLGLNAIDEHVFLKQILQAVE